MKKLINIIAKIFTIIFGGASIMWILRMFGALGMRFHEDYLSRVGTCIIIFVICLIITLCTNKKK